MKAIQDLPLGWAIAPIGDVCSQPQYGYTTKASKNGDLRLLRTSDITSGRINWETVPYCSENPDDMEKYILKDGDILVSRAGSVGVSHLVANPLEAVFASYLIRFKPFIDKQFLAYFLQSPNYWVTIADQQLGIAVPNVNATKLKSIMVPIPPEREQRRIAAKIDELFSELNKGIESLKTARRQLAVYRQSVLKHAFEGRLTARWRAENKDKLETPEQTLARIKRERSTRYEQQLREWNAAVSEWEEGGKSGIKPSKPAGFKSQAPIVLSELIELPDIPQLWQYVRLSEIALVGSGMSLSKSRKLTDPIQIPYLSVANVQRGELDLSRVKTMEVEHSQLPRLALRRWDVLFNEGGDRDKLGRGCVWEAQIEPCITQNHVFRASPFSESHPHSKWISHWGNSFGQLYFEAQGKQTTNLASINKTVLSNFPIPLPPIAEQEEIIRRLESQMAIVDHLERDVASSLGQLSAIRQSILKKAFSGQLVAQDPDDEPASVLLDRIKAESKQKAKNGMVRRRTRKRKATV